MFSFPTSIPINKINDKMVDIIYGQQESYIPGKELAIKNYLATTFPGCHHYDSDWWQACQAIAAVAQIKKCRLY